MAKTSIRPIRAADAERVRRILQVAFEDEYQRMGLKSSRIPVMNDQLLAFYLDRAREYSFAAERRGGLIGFCLACRWGSTAWMGPIAVLPPAQGDGWGRKLVEASTNLLRQGGVTTLGVETMPRSYRNLQFYSSLGMRFACMTLDMSRTYSEESQPSTPSMPVEGLEMHTLGRMTEGEGIEAIDSIATISDAVSTGLDYRPEVETTRRHGIGETLLACWNDQPVGFAILHTEPYAREEIPGTIRVTTLLVKPSAEGVPGVDLLIEGMLDLIEWWAGAEGYDAVIVRVPVRYVQVRDSLLRRGYTITHSDIRMTYMDMGETDEPGTIHLSKWE